MRLHSWNMLKENQNDETKLKNRKRHEDAAGQEHMMQ